MEGRNRISELDRFDDFGRFQGLERGLDFDRRSNYDRLDLGLISDDKKFEKKKVDIRDHPDLQRVVDPDSFSSDSENKSIDHEK